jgi:hypothetical protein
MASANAIHDMSETLVHLLRAGLSRMHLHPKIYVATPDEFADLQKPGTPHITVFLYRISVNPQLRNSPRRTLSTGQIVRQLLPLELSYLITAWARETRDELKMVGRIAQILYDHAELGAADLHGNGWEPDDTVQLVLESLPLEDHYRIWDASEVPYRLSLTYQARVIGISPVATDDVPPVVTASIGAAE